VSWHLAAPVSALWLDALVLHFGFALWLCTLALHFGWAFWLDDFSILARVAFELLSSSVTHHRFGDMA
jgi:hypothetical protein